LNNTQLISYAATLDIRDADILPALFAFAITMPLMLLPPLFTLPLSRYCRGARSHADYLTEKRGAVITFSHKVNIVEDQPRAARHYRH